MAALLDHSTIGKIQGIAGDGVTQYLGVKYGVLADRFAEAKLPDYAHKSTIDATKHAPAPLSPPDGVDIENSLLQLQKPLPYNDRRVSDIDGLALNITVPDGTTPTSRYPVLAYLHGGGLNIGSSNWPIYDFTRLVRRSVSRGFPVICVGINYRLDIPGFLSSTALLAAGYKANRGFRDQQLALKWIAKHIAEFGGDPNHVTICGQSAGAVSIAYLFQSDEALFKRAIVMSGSDLLLKAEPPCDAGFDTACKALGLEDKSAEDKVKGMTSVPAEELLSKIGLSVRIGPVLDDDLFKLENSHESLIRGTPKLPATKWLDALLIGDCAFDANIMAFFLSPGKPTNAGRFIKAAGDVLSSPDAQKVYDIYGVTPDTSDEQALVATLQFIDDITWHAATQAYATHFASSGRPVYAYHFAAPNPFPGRWEGESTHILDSLFLFQNYNSDLSEAAQHVAEGMADRFLAFAAGQVPFEAWTHEHRNLCVFGPDDVRVVQSRPQLKYEARRVEFHKLAANVGYDKFAAVYGAIMAA